MYINFVYFKFYFSKKIADRLKIPKSYLSWIPLANQYIVGSVAFYGKRTKTVAYTLIVNLFSLFSIIIDLVCYFGGEKSATIFYLFWTSYFLNIAVFIFCVIARYRMYSMFSEKAKVITAVDVLISIRFSPVFMFFLRNKKFTTPVHFEERKQKLT